MSVENKLAKIDVAEANGQILSSVVKYILLTYPHESHSQRFARFISFVKVDRSMARMMWQEVCSDFFAAHDDMDLSDLDCAELAGMIFLWCKQRTTELQSEIAKLDKKRVVSKTK
jgi:hypothetical protein